MSDLAHAVYDSVYFYYVIRLRELPFVIGLREVAFIKSIQTINKCLVFWEICKHHLLHYTILTEIYAEFQAALQKYT